MTVNQAPPETRALWTDPNRSAGQRVEALLAEMTTAEKVAQLGSTWHRAPNQYRFEEDDPERAGVAPMEEAFGAVRDWGTVRKIGVGHLTRVYGTAPVDPSDGAARLAQLQNDLLEHSRLGIPAIAHEECLTGFTTLGATVYPTPLALAATFDVELVERLAARIGADLKAAGVQQALAPVMDVVSDPRWGRTEESMGEDPYLVGLIGSACVRGLESVGIVATLKHFAGHAASRAARNHAPVSLGPRELADVHLTPFEMGIRLGGARSVMNSYADVDGLPPAADRTLLTGLLRDDWRFEGTVVSDYGSIGFLVNMHRVAATPTAAGSLALEAGIDVELPETHCYSDELADLVDSGEVSGELLDRSVRRILQQKLELGLMDDGWAPPRPGTIELDRPENRALARQAAEASIVLLTNNGILPLPAEPGRIAVVGPGADHPSAFLGCYSYPNHVLPRHPEHGLGIPVTSVLDAIRDRWPETTIASRRGCAVTDALDDDVFDPDEIRHAAAEAAKADVTVLVLADQPGVFGRGTSGEGNDAFDLSLPGRQGELARQVLATGTPTIVVVVSGRPYALEEVAGSAAAVVQSFLPGAEGGPALAAILAGDVEPAGRLPIQIPTQPGGQPASYRHPVLGEPGLGISSADVVPLFPFGHGCSYTTFEWLQGTLSTKTMAVDGTVEVDVTVANSGDRPGAEVIQIYLDDPVAQVARPVRQLVAAQPVQLDPGDRATITFALHADRFAYTGRTGERIVDAGTLDLHVGPSSADARFTLRLDVTGDTRILGPERHLATPGTVQLHTAPPSLSDKTGDD